MECVLQGERLLLMQFSIKVTVCSVTKVKICCCTVEPIIKATSDVGTPSLIRTLCNAPNMHALKYKSPQAEVSSLQPLPAVMLEALVL